MKSELKELIVLFDIFGNLMLRKPNKDLLNKIQFHNTNSIEINNLVRKIQKSLESEHNFSELEKLYEHLFEQPSKCMLTTHQSLYYFNRIKPDFLNELLAEIGIKHNSEGGNYADHIGNQTLLIAYLYQMINKSEDSNDVITIERVFNKFMNLYYIDNLKKLNIEIKVCKCFEEINIYQEILKFILCNVENMPHVNLDSVN